MGNPFTTLETLIRSLVQAMSATNQSITSAVDSVKTAIDNAAPVTSSQPANQFLASPSTGAGTPGFRDIVTADIQTAADSRYAQKGGSASQIFQVADGTASNDAVAYEQIKNTTALPWAGNYGGNPAVVTATTGTFTAPTKGNLIITGLAEDSTGSSAGITLSASLSGLIVLGSGSGNYISFGNAVLPMTTGETTTLSVNSNSTASSGGTTVFITALFVPSP